MLRIKLMADYDSWPLWDVDKIRNIDPETMPISVSMKAALKDWSAVYDDTLNRNNPIESGFASPNDKASFNATGRKLWWQLRSELPNYHVTYFDIELAKIIDHHDL